MARLLFRAIAIDMVKYGTEAMANPLYSPVPGGAIEWAGSSYQHPPRIYPLLFASRDDGPHDIPSLIARGPLLPATVPDWKPRGIDATHLPSAVASSMVLKGLALQAPGSPATPV